MLRRVLATAAMVLMAGGVGLGQENQTDAEAAKRLAEAQKWWDKYLEKHPTEVPGLVGKVGAKPVELPKVEVGKDDSPVVKAAKRALAAEQSALKLMRVRIELGHFAGGGAFTKMTWAAVGMYSAAQLIWDDPAKLLPWAEYQLAVFVEVERFIGPRVEQGVEEPELLPLLEAARCKAEVLVLQLREKAKKK
jgi:hypothetical protein